MNKERKNILDNDDFKKNPFEIPEDYFETNSIKLIENICLKNNLLLKFLKITLKPIKFIF
jgi:hypothetical protein